MNGRPLGIRARIRILIALLILFWATQTMLHKWGFGAEVDVSAGLPAAPVPHETFVPDTSRATATLEMCEESNVRGGEVKLKQVCRWADADQGVFLPVCDLVLFRMGDDTAFQSIDLEFLKGTLREAGVNLAAIRFSGPTRCTVRRLDSTRADPSQTMDQWIAAHRGDALPPARPAPASHVVPMPIALEVTSEPVVTPAAAHLGGGVMAARGAGVSTPTRSAEPVNHSLRELLLADLSSRLNIQAELLQVSFNPRDENILALAEPTFKFSLEPRRVRDLGQVSWDVTVVSFGQPRTASITASAKAWQSQVVVNRPISYKQVLRPQDLSQARALVDHVADETLLTLSQAVGQQAARDLKPGAVLTARMVDAVAMVRSGQLVSITAASGAIRLRTVARAMEAGTFGQTIRVRDDTTNDIYNIIVTGQQEGTVGSVPAVEAPLATAP